MTKRLVFIILPLFALAILMGCFMKENNVEKKMLSHMEEKYGEEFCILEPYAGQFGKEYTALKLQSLKYPEKEVLVRMRTEKGNVYIEDNYTAILLQPMLEQRIKDVAKEAFGPCRVSYQIPMEFFPERFSTGMDAEAFLTDPDVSSRFFIEPDMPLTKKNCQDTLKAFLKTCGERGYRIRGSVINGEEQLLFSANRDGSLLYMRWLGKAGEGK